MKYLIISILFLLLLPGPQMQAQNTAAPRGSVIGAVVDSVSGEPLLNATAILKRVPDSIMVRAALTDASGAIRMERLPAGEYIFEVSYLGYQPWRRKLRAGGEAAGVDLGKIRMSGKLNLMQEITVREDRIPVTIKKDTLEFDAGAFKVPENSAVEDLLKKLPGVEVDRDGTVRAMGQQVQEVTVDGNPFFGNDPKIATKNLPANIIDKVQVIDKKSEEAQFSQIEDGNMRKSINLKLKKDKNSGIFGNATLGGGTEDRFQGKLNLNRFKGGDQLSLLASGNNLNELGFTMQDAMSFSGGFGGLSGMGLGEQGANGGVTVQISQGSSGSNSISAGNGGISTPWSGGLNFRDRLSKKFLASGSYFYNSVGTENETKRQRQNLLGEGQSFNYNETGLSDQGRDNHRVNLQFDYDIDSMSNLQIKPSFSYNANNTDYTSDYQTLSFDNSLLNSGLSSYFTDQTSTAAATEVLFRKKFGKQGRNFSASFTGNFSRPQSDQVNKSFSTLRQRGSGDLITDTIDQQQLREDRNLRGRFRLNYTEPIGRNKRLGFFYEGSRSQQESDQRGFDFNPQTGRYDLVNDIFTNNFENHFTIDQGGIQLQFQRLRSDLTLGVSAQQSSISSVSLGQENSFERSFFNVFPLALYNYNFSQTKRLQLAYRATTREPSISELQPVPDNRNPQYIQLGNPELKPAFNHEVSVNYNAFEMGSMRSLFARFSVASVVNQIVRSNAINEFGQQVSQPINADGAAFNMNGFIAFGFPIKALKLNTNLSTMGRYNRYSSLINNAENETESILASQRLRFSYDREEKLNIGISGGITFNSATYSLQPFLNSEFFSYDVTTDLSVELPFGFRLESDLGWRQNSGGSDLYNNRAVLWNATFSKYFLKNKQGSIELRAFDLLRQNVSISRNTGENYVEDVQNLVLGQYFMLRATYRFGAFGGPGMPGGAVRMMRF